MKQKSLARFLVPGLLTVAFTVQGLAQKSSDDATRKLVERGKFLVDLGGCNHCHTTKVMTPMGPVPDTTKTLSGSPEGMPIPAIPEGTLVPGKWGVLTTMDLTMWAGPWGVSFARNLTPDKATGLGSWTEKMFIKALRTGKDMGEGRPILPPMPWQDIGALPDRDLKAVFAYLRSLPPIKNAIHDPVPPPGAPAGGK